MLHALRTAPSLFAKAFLGRTLWERQVDILDALQKTNVAVRSCNGAGKTTVAAQAVLQWMLIPNTIVVTTAPTARQVESVLWGEIRSMLYAASGRPVKLPSGQVCRLGVEGLTRTDWRLTDKWYAIGLSTDQPERFAGFHSARVLGIIDEASGVDQEIFDAIKGCTNGPEDRILAISNPTREDGPFFDIFNDSRIAAGWQRFHIDGETLPWVVNRQPPPAPGLVTWQWVEDRKADWGAKFPNIYAIRVRGDFASEGGCMLLSRAEIEAATVAEVAPGTHRVLAVDVALSGGDETVLSWFDGKVQTGLVTYRKARTNETTGFIVQSLQTRPVDVIVIDAIGVGAGVFDRLNELHNEGAVNAKIVSFQGSEKASRADQYLNLRAESCFAFAEAVKSGTVRLLADDLQTAQLAFQPYTCHSDGRLKLLSKLEISKKGRGSPDRADATVMAFWQASGAGYVPVTPYRRPRRSAREPHWMHTAVST